ncbi:MULTISPECIES: glycosyltransferase family 2 protein [Leptolyngbya]|uniref:glycosyltransferase family 2 protein n=1 Tax=Leptolyngbya TaxID=47251 RepID=UPI00168A1F82|nr:glycosyltransferase family 2 protein [Leptolyngbya sp. FACHB-1624]MBD1855180.1 glycosyltransferase family 2 protein [Leptolyngbya sp. FACHB-1624]
MDSNLPTVSIGLPVFNGEDYLEAALESLLAQTYTNFEIVLCDNASSDRTAEICQTYAAKDARIRYYRNDHNIGAAENFDRVFQLSRGKYFKWAAHDDLCKPTFLERCVEVLDRDLSVVLCTSEAGRIDWAGNEQPPKADSPRPIDAWEVAERFEAIVLKTFWSYEIFGLIRSSALKKLNLRRSNYGSDRVILAELSLQGRLVHVPEMLFFRRFHLKQSTCMQSAKERQQWHSGNRKRSIWERGSVGFMQAVFQADLTPAERVQCMGVVLRYLTKAGNWRYFLPKHFRQTKKPTLTQMPAQSIASKG